MKIFTVTTLALLALLFGTQNSNAQCDIIGIWQIKEVSIGSEITSGDALLGLNPKIEFTEDKIIVTAGGGEYHDEETYTLKDGIITSSDDSEAEIIRCSGNQVIISQMEGGERIIMSLVKPGKKTAKKKSKKPKKKKGLKNCNIIGTWKIEMVTMGDLSMSAAMLGNARIEFTETEMTSTGLGSEQTEFYKLEDGYIMGKDPDDKMKIESCSKDELILSGDMGGQEGQIVLKRQP